MLNGTSHRFRIVTALSILAMMMGSLWIPGVAATGSGSEHQPSLTAQAGESFDFLQINITDSDGDSISFPAGREICLNVLIDGGSPLPSPCYASLPGQTLHAGSEASPFLRSSSYSLVVASNNTGCDVTAPAMLPQDFGESGWYAIFNVTVTCADVILPTIVIPEPTTIVPLPTFDFPTPTPTIDSTTPMTAPIIEGYERVTLRFVPAIPGVTPAILPGEVCARLVVNPPLTGAALADHCHTRSTAIHDYFPTEGASFPMASLYSAIVVSNESGCTATPGAFREYLADFGEAAEVDVIIDCLGSSATEISGASEYADLSLLITDGNTALHVYPGQICVQVSVDPPLDSGSWVGTMCESQSPETTVWHSSEYVSLPVSSTYTATVVSNGTGCIATPAVGVVNDLVDGRVVGRMVVRLDCTSAPETPVPSPYEAVHVELRDSTGLYRYYDAEICFDVAITPNVPVIGNEWVCQYYASPTGTSLTILPGDDGLPVTSTYTANVFSNETGCEFTQSFRAEDGEGYITILTTCPEPEAFSGVRLHLYDAGGEETLDLGGELCVAVDVLPVLASGGRIGELCVTSVEASEIWVPTGVDTFPYDNAYAPRVTSNTSTCTAGPMRRTLHSEDGGLVLGLAMPVTCDDATPTATAMATETPAPTATATPTGTPPVDEYYSFGVRFDDVRGDDYTYPGQLCVKVIVTPPLHSDPTVGELCSDTAWAADTWVSMAPGQFPRSGTYIAAVESNETGCEAVIDPEVVVGGVEGTITGHIQVWIDCAEPTEAPAPTATATGTPVPIEPTIPTATRVSTETPVTIPPTSTATPGAMITGLPTTGSGPLGGTTTAILAGTGLVFLLGSWVVARNRIRR